MSVVKYDEYTVDLIEAILIDGYVNYAKRIYDEISCPHTREEAGKLFVKWQK